MGIKETLKTLNQKPKEKKMTKAKKSTGLREHIEGSSGKGPYTAVKVQPGSITEQIMDLEQTAAKISSLITTLYSALAPVLTAGDLVEAESLKTGASTEVARSLQECNANLAQSLARLDSLNASVSI